MSEVTEELEVFAHALRQLRAIRDWTHREVGAAAELDPNQIALVERGTRSPTLSTMVKICRGAFKMSLVDFLAVGKREQVKQRKKAEEVAQ